MTQHTVRAVGIAWYSRQDYPRILQIMEDGSKLPETYYHWLKSAEVGERQLSKSGMTVFRAHIVPDEFLAWCQRNGLRPNADARMRWGNEFVYSQVKTTH